jgi:hypothetical protein
MQAAARASQRNIVKDAASNYKSKRMMRNGGFSALIALLAASTILFFANRSETPDTPQAQEMAPISQAVKTRLDNNQDFANIPIQYFQIPAQGCVQLSTQGVLISVPEAAFLKDGKPYLGNVILQYQEAIKGIDIVTSGLSTITGDDLLETQGMFSVTGYTEDGEALYFNPEVGVYLQSPIDDCKSGMQLYDGKKMEDGSIDWVDPVPLEKIPTSVDMADLDFYPEGYQKYLDSEKWNRDKKSRDSLYLSLEHSMDLQAITDAANSQNEAERMASEADQLIVNEFGKVYGKNKSKGDSIASIDDIIAWDFSSKLIGNDIWEITAQAVIRTGFYIYSSTEEDINKKTQVVLNETIYLEPIEETEDLTLIENIQTKDGAAKGFTEFASFTKKVKVNTSSQIGIPVRVIFKVGNKQMEYSRVMRRTTVFVGQSEEQQISRLDSLANVQMDGDFILPSNVMSFWKPAFNNTNLSTREFESRMTAVHATCDNEVLLAYVENLDRNISEIDKEIVSMGYREFTKFADQNIGKIDIDDPHLSGLTEFYDKATNALRKDAQSKVKTAEERMKQWNSIVNDQRSLDQSRAAKRNQQYVEGLRNFSRQNLVRQFRNSNGFRITSGSFGSPTARKNCDRWRPFSATQLAKADTTSTIFIAEESSSKYNEFKIAVAEANNYIDVYMYLFADNVNSYQRLKGENGAFSAQLNDEITYAIGIVALTEKGYAFYEHDFLKGGDLGTVELKEISEKRLASRIEKINGNRL